MVRGFSGQDEEAVPGRCLGLGDVITHEGRWYRVRRRSADHGALLVEVAYAPTTPW